MDKKHVGARNELAACVWLLNQGYEVFRNVSPHGLVDLIAKKGAEIIFIDVKAAPKVMDIKQVALSKVSKAQFEAGVHRLNVFPDGTCAMIRGTTTRITVGCHICGKSYERRTSLQRFCSPNCKITHGNRMSAARDAARKNNQTSP